MDFLSSWHLYAGFVIRMSMLTIAVPILLYMSRFIKDAFSERFSQHSGVLIGHVIFYGGMGIIVVNMLHEFGFNVTALVGAAGVVGVAIGFASQTSVSNIISGFFLLLEHPFSIGDEIKSGEVIGMVESIDLLAVRVRTRDNKLIRVPNEMVLKNSLTNLTFYAKKRIDLLISFPYGFSTDIVVKRINQVIASDTIFLSNPSATIVMKKVDKLPDDTQIRVFFTVNVWSSKDQFKRASGLLIKYLKSEFDVDQSIVTIVQLN
jgi:small-conductance mechanosensitive channel